jgi:hypothetical protein
MSAPPPESERGPVASPWVAKQEEGIMAGTFTSDWGRNSTWTGPTTRLEGAVPAAAAGGGAGTGSTTPEGVGRHQSRGCPSARVLPTGVGVARATLPTRAGVDRPRCPSLHRAAPRAGDSRPHHPHCAAPGLHRTAHAVSRSRGPTTTPSEQGQCHPTDGSRGWWMEGDERLHLILSNGGGGWIELMRFEPMRGLHLCGRDPWLQLRWVSTLHSANGCFTGCCTSNTRWTPHIFYSFLISISSLKTSLLLSFYKINLINYVSIYQIHKTMHI